MFKIALKDLKVFFRDRRAMMLTFIVPIALITLFAFAFGGTGKDKSESRATVLVASDEDQTVASRNVLTQLDSLKEFDIDQTTTDSAIRLVKEGDEAIILILHKGFGDSINSGLNPPVEFMYDGAQEGEAGILRGALTGQLMKIIGSASISKNIVSKFDKKYPGLDSTTRNIIHSEISSNFNSDSDVSSMDSFIKATPLISEGENSPGLIQAVAGTAIMMLLFSVVGMGASMLDEKQEGTLKRLLYSPLRPAEILVGKLIFTYMISILQLTIMFIYAYLVFGLDILHHLPSLLLMILATAFACSAFGVFLASFAKSRQQVQGLATLIILVMSCIGGSMVPTFMMPMFMQKLSVFSVNYWGIQGFYDIFWRKISVSDPIFLSRILVLFLIGLLLNLVALQMFRKNILKIA